MKLTVWNVDFILLSVHCVLLVVAGSFELTAFHQTGYWHRITFEFITESAIMANTKTVLIAEICEAVCSLPSRVQYVLYRHVCSMFTTVTCAVSDKTQLHKNKNFMEFQRIRLRAEYLQEVYKCFTKYENLFSRIGKAYKQRIWKCGPPDPGVRMAL